MSDLRISTQPGDTNGAERAKRATAVTDAMAFATTTGAMLLGILAAEAEQQQASAAAVGHDVQDLQGATAPHDTPQVDAGALAPEASGANAASLLPINGDTQPQAQSTADTLLHHVVDHAAPLADPSTMQPVSDPLSEAGATAWHSTSQADASAQEQTSDGALSALALTDIGATEALPDSLTDALQDLSATAVQTLETTLTSAGQTVLDLVDQTAQLIEGATAALHNPIGSMLDPALGSISSTLGDVSGTLGHALGSPGGAEATLTEVPAALTAATAIEPAVASLPMIDAHPLVSDVTAPVQVDTAPLQLGFLGQSYVDSGDPHDGAFSAVGVHGFV